MKDKFTVIILCIIGFILVFSGSMFLFSNLSPKDESKINETKKLKKIKEEEINHELATEILEFYLEKQPIEEKIEIKSAKILANTLDGEYLVRVELDSVLDEDSSKEKDVSIQYLGDGKWKVNLPLQSTGGIAEKYTEFWPVEDLG